MPLQRSDPPPRIARIRLQSGQAGFCTAFPEQSVDIHELLAEGDRVVARHTQHAVHGGEFAGLPPTGITATVDGLELFRLRVGKIAELWHHDDLLGLMQQLGAGNAA